MDLKELSLLLQNISILYVEDDIQTQKQMVGILSQLSNKIVVASSGNEALKIYNISAPQIIISDIAMPDLNGIEFIRKIREQNLKIPIILLTAHSDVDYLLPAANLNIQSYIIKPITKEKLKEVLINALEILNMNSSIFLELSNDYKYDKVNSEIIYSDNKKVKLNKKEKNLIDLLISNKNKVVSYSQIEHHVWMQYDEVMTNMALRTVIKNLRKKTTPDLIINVSGQGYKILI